MYIYLLSFVRELVIEYKRVCMGEYIFLLQSFIEIRKGVRSVWVDLDFLRGVAVLILIRQMKNRLAKKLKRKLLEKSLF